MVGLTGLVMPSQWGYAAEPGDNRISATPEMMQLLRDEHDLVAEMIRGQLLRSETGTKSKERQSIPYPTHGRMIAPRLRCVAAATADGCRDDLRNNDAALLRPLRALRRVPKLRPRTAPCADRSGLVEYAHGAD